MIFKLSLALQLLFITLSCGQQLHLSSPFHLQTPHSLHLTQQASQVQQVQTNKVAQAQRRVGGQLSIKSTSAAFSRALPNHNFRLDEYHTLRDIYAYVDALSIQYPSIVRSFDIGSTHEQRPIKAIEITQNSSDSDFVWLDSLTHAREWITGSTLIYIIDSVVAARARPLGTVEQVSTLGQLHRKNFIIIPVVNPDGYEHTWTSNRLWRKNRAPNGKCLGADLNRNFAHASFGGEGSSSDSCSQIFAGSSALSERETRAITDLMWSLKDRIKFYLTIHSYNQLWACPYAHTLSRSASYAKHMRVLRAIQRAVRASEGVTYDIGPLGESLYVGSGFGIDFAYDSCKIEHSYLVELRDKGARGFVLPADQILPTARETFAGLEAGLEVAFRLLADDSRVGKLNGSNDAISFLNPASSSSSLSSWPLVLYDRTNQQQGQRAWQ